jgi:hypothetical protein
MVLYSNNRNHREVDLSYVLQRAVKSAIYTYTRARFDIHMPVHRKYRVIHKTLRNFRNQLLNNQDRHGRKEHVNR